ncbi:hypothetical protein B0H19DRAFT_1055631 [Mycena capillaripes]|nr:hypothetical protein B0H19DRAFT_1055631 [Mycena capillaripes]
MAAEEWCITTRAGLPRTGTSQTKHNFLSSGYSHPSRTSPLSCSFNSAFLVNRSGSMAQQWLWTYPPSHGDDNTIFSSWIESMAEQDSLPSHSTVIFQLLQPYFLSPNPYAPPVNIRFNILLISSIIRILHPMAVSCQMKLTHLARIFLLVYPPVPVRDMESDYSHFPSAPASSGSDWEFHVAISNASDFAFGEFSNFESNISRPPSVAISCGTLASASSFRDVEQALSTLHGSFENGEVVTASRQRETEIDSTTSSSVAKTSATIVAAATSEHETHMFAATEDRKHTAGITSTLKPDAAAASLGKRKKDSATAESQSSRAKRPKKDPLSTWSVERVNRDDTTVLTGQEFATLYPDEFREIYPQEAIFGFFLMVDVLTHPKDIKGASPHVMVPVMAKRNVPPKQTVPPKHLIF